MKRILLILNQSKKVFLLDAIGAFFSAFLLFFIHEILNKDFYNLPNQIITFLYATAGIYMVYSFTCYMLVANKWKKFLSILIGLNLLYILMVVLVLLLFKEQITPLGLSYFLIEIGVISLIIRIEYIAFKQLKH